MLANGVDLAGVNVMTMDYGGSREPGVAMYDATAQCSPRDLAPAGRRLRAGRPSPDRRADVWRKIGATPMIGQNDTPDDHFSLDDAEDLTAFAGGQHGLGRLSMWSANRDVQCGVQAGPLLSNTCSGVTQRPLAFTWELGRLGQRLPGRVRISEKPEPVRATSRDNPETSPYPIWRPRRSYSGGDKVVWHARVCKRPSGGRRRASRTRR